MRKSLLASVAALFIAGACVHVAVFANANSQSKLYVCATPQQNILLQADYEALTWVEVKGLGNHGETGIKTNILNYDTWGDIVIQKTKGLTDAGSPTVECARISNDPGQIILRTAGAPTYNFNLAFKMVRNDPLVVGGTPTILYNRGLVAGPTRPMGKNEDFDLEVYTLGLNQIEIVVAPGAGGNPPVLTVSPAITGTATVGQVLTCSTGTFTGDATITYAYQWFAGGVAISGANASTFTLTSAQLGKVITARVTGTNASGSASGYAPATTAVA